MAIITVAAVTGRVFILETRLSLTFRPFIPHPLHFSLMSLTSPAQNLRIKEFLQHLRLCSTDRTSSDLLEVPRGVPPSM